LRVAPAGPLTRVGEALRLAADGDTIEVLPGEYRGDVAVITQRQLTIRGIGQRPVFSADGRDAEGKAIWVVRDGDIRVENLEFRGARVADGNGAGIRFERGRLHLLRCAFFDNEMGLLSGNVENAELRVEDCEFGAAPQHAGSLHHLLYVGRIGRFILTGSRLHGGWRGHLLKSRARESTIAHNRIDDGAEGQASYEIDLPNGGLARVVGNVVGQSPRTENAVLVAYGAEGAAWPGSALVMVHNRLINRLPEGGQFLKVWPERLPAGTPVWLVRNLTAGPGELGAGGLPGLVQGNRAAAAADPEPQAAPR
jgi:hypothetical protein